MRLMLRGSVHWRVLVCTCTSSRAPRAPARHLVPPACTSTSSRAALRAPARYLVPLRAPARRLVPI